MRSLSPSRTLTWTRTVSPGLIAGRFTIFPRSTVSTALMSPSPCFDAVLLTAPDLSHPVTPSPASPDARRACAPALRAGAIVRSRHDAPTAAPAAPATLEIPQDACTADNPTSRA